MMAQLERVVPTKRRDFPLNAYDSQALSMAISGAVLVNWKGLQLKCWKAALTRSRNNLTVT